MSSCSIASSAPGKLGNEFESGGEVGDGLSIGGALEGPLTSEQPELQRPLRHRCRGEVVGDDLRVEFRFRPPGQRLGDHLMMGDPGAPEQRIVGDVLDKGVLERIGDRVDAPLALQQAGRHEVLEAALEPRLLARPDRLQELAGDLPAERGGELGDLDRRALPIKAGHQQITECRRDRPRQRRVDPGGVGHDVQQHLCRLFDEQRDAVGAIGDLAL